MILYPALFCMSSALLVIFTLTDDPGRRADIRRHDLQLVMVIIHKERVFGPRTNSRSRKGSLVPTER